MLTFWGFHLILHVPINILAHTFIKTFSGFPRIQQRLSSFCDWLLLFSLPTVSCIKVSCFPCSFGNAMSPWVSILFTFLCANSSLLSVTKEWILLHPVLSFFRSEGLYQPFPTWLKAKLLIDSWIMRFLKKLTGDFEIYIEMQSTKNSPGNLFFFLFILPIQEHGISLHLLVSFLISFIRVL